MSNNKCKTCGQSASSDKCSDCERRESSYGDPLEIIDDALDTLSDAFSD